MHSLSTNVEAIIYVENWERFDLSGANFHLLVNLITPQCCSRINFNRFVGSHFSRYRFVKYSQSLSQIYIYIRMRTVVCFENRLLLERGVDKLYVVTK